MKKVLFFIALIITAPALAMQEEPQELDPLEEREQQEEQHKVEHNILHAWRTIDQAECARIPPDIVKKAAIDCLAKPGTRPFQLRATFLLWQELSSLQKHSDLDTLIKLVILRHISPNAVTEHETEPNVPMDYPQNICHYPFYGTRYTVPLVYNKNWQKIPEETIPRQNNLADINNRPAPLCHATASYNTRGLKKKETLFERCAPEPTLTQNIDHFCQLVHNKQIAFNTPNIIDAINSVTPELVLNNKHSFKHLSLAQELLALSQFQQGLTHLKRFHTFLDKQRYQNTTDEDISMEEYGAKNVMNLQKALVPAMIKSWQALPCDCSLL